MHSHCAPFSIQPHNIGASLASALRHYGLVTPSPSDTSPFLYVMAESHHKVLTLRLLTLCCDISSRLLRVTPSAFQITIIWSLLAPCVATIASLTDRHAWNISLIFVADYSVLLYLLIYFPTTSWAALQRASPAIDALMPDIRSREQVAAWFGKRLDLRFQACLSLLGLAVGVGTTLAIVMALNLRLVDCIPCLIAVALAGALGINAGWWLWQAPSLATLLARLPHTRLDWVSPVDTPGVAAGRQLLLQSARRALGGAVITVAPIVITALAEPASSTVLAVIFGVTAFSFTTAVSLLIMPQYRLIQMVRRFKTALLAELRPGLSCQSYADPSPSTLKQLAVYRGWRSGRRQLGT